MNLLLYTPEKTESGQKLRATIGSLVPQERLEIYHTLESLLGRLHRPRRNLNIAVLNLTSGEELSNVVVMRELLSDLRVVLVIPDRDNATISKAHLLTPRFLTYADSDFVEVGAVLHKLIGRIQGSCN